MLFLNLLQQAFGGGHVGGPRAQVNLNFTRRGQDRRLHVGVSRVNRRDALVDIGFAHSRDAQFPRHQAHSGGKTRNPLLDLRAEHGLQFVRRAGKQDDDAPARFEPKSGRGAAIVFRDIRALRHHRLTGVHFRHRCARVAGNALRSGSSRPGRARVFCRADRRRLRACGRPLWGRGRRWK